MISKPWKFSVTPFLQYELHPKKAQQSFRLCVKHHYYCCIFFYLNVSYRSIIVHHSGDEGQCCENIFVNFHVMFQQMFALVGFKFHLKAGNGNKTISARVALGCPSVPTHSLYRQQNLNKDALSYLPNGCFKNPNNLNFAVVPLLNLVAA